jgi:6-phosphogluconolactonase
MMPELVVVPDLAVEACERFLALRPRTVALAGGSTPRSFYERLAGYDFPWSQTEVFFGDERCVPPDHPQSNYRMANQALLSKAPARVHRMAGESCDTAAYEDELTEVFGTGPPVFDLVLLGLGEDGHTASLFPGDAALDEKERRVVRVQRPDCQRLTLTLPVLSAAKMAIFLVAGESRRGALRRLIEGEDIPAARVAAEKVVIIADEAAWTTAVRIPPAGGSW